jgi:plasmid maintenance system antidote protein VapI
MAAASEDKNMVKPRPLHQKNGLLLAEMIRHGYTLKSLAKAADLHYLTVWRIVNQQHRPTRQNAARIGALLGLPPAKLGLQVWRAPPPEQPDTPD